MLDLCVSSRITIDERLTPCGLVAPGLAGISVPFCVQVNAPATEYGKRTVKYGTT